MWKPQVTITLGRNGQKVVRRPQSVPDRSRTDSHTLSGGKRSISGRVGSSADGSVLRTNKRLRGDLAAFGPNYSRVHDACVGKNDLRLKLMHKEQLKRMQTEAEVRKKRGLRRKMSRTSQPTERSLLGSTSHTQGSGEMLQVESSRNPYPYYTRSALNPRSIDRVLIDSRQTSPHAHEVWRVPSRGPSDASSTGRSLENGTSYLARTTGPASITMRATHNAGKSITGSPAGGPPLTVSSLLHSLGLGKYAILLQAEEVDMVALKQMRDNDLKQLGIPMGPRKKILLALVSYSKRKPF